MADDTAPMEVSRRSRWCNPGAWFTALGLVLLASTVWVPFQAAERTARVERRADQIAALLLEATARASGATLRAQWDPATVEIVLAYFHALALREGAFVNDLERLDQPLPDSLLTLQNKHYAFQIAVSPPAAKETPSEDAEPAYEVTAWPLSPVSPGHCVFFYPENAPRAYTRNLAKGYTGLGDQRITPGRGHRRPAQTLELRVSYRGLDDERWIFF
jgi:hypothetical protein